MAKRKSGSKKGARGTEKTSSQAPAAVPAFSFGQRVKVLSGDYGQAVGTVGGPRDDGRVMVHLSNVAADVPGVAFDPSNLAAF